MRHKTLVFVGVILIAAGAMGVFYRAIPYTSRDVVIDVGPLKATAETSKTWPVPPILGGLAIAGGILMIIAGARKT